MLISQHITDNAYWTRKLFAGLGALALTSVLVPGGFVQEAEAQFVCGDTAGDGQGADATGSGSNTACGPNANAAGTTSANTAAGLNANASGDVSANTATGRDANASGDISNNLAIGRAASASGGLSNNVTIGSFASSSGDNSNNVAIGQSALASGDNSTLVAIGAESQATGSNSVALGANSVADEINTVSVGEKGVFTRRITNVAMGARSNDAVTVKQLRKSLKKSFAKGKAKVVKGTIQTSNQAKTSSQAKTAASTSKAKTTAGTSKTKTKSSGGGSTSSGGSGPATVSQTSFDQFASKTETQIDRLAQRDNKLAEGIAVVAALAQPVLLPGQHFAMRAGWGGYDSANAVAFSAAGVIADNLLRSGHGTLSLDGGVGWGTDEGEVVGRAGATFGW